MSTLERILIFYILPVVAVLLYPPQMLVRGIGVLAVVVVLFILLGVLLQQGRSLALTFSIFVQGLNVIIRLMTFWNNGFSREGVPNVAFIITCLLGLALSFWLLVRLDHQDIRVQMIR